MHNGNNKARTDALRPRLIDMLGPASAFLLLHFLDFDRLAVGRDRALDHPVATLLEVLGNIVALQKVNLVADLGSRAASIGAGVLFEVAVAATNGAGPLAFLLVSLVVGPNSRRRASEPARTEQQT